MAEDKKDEQGQDGLQKLLEKHNRDAMALAGELYSQTFQLRDKNRVLRDENDELKKKIPGADIVILSKTDAERWEEYKKLGKPDDIKAIVNERDTLKSENAKAQRRELLRNVAEAEGFEPDVLFELVADNLSFEIKEVKNKDGKQIKQTNVIIDADGKKETKVLSEYAEEKWQKFMPALKQEVEEQPPLAEGTKYLKQKKGEPITPPDRVAEERKRLVATGDYQL